MKEAEVIIFFVFVLTFQIKWWRYMGLSVYFNEREILLNILQYVRWSKQR